jgi:hypothetical protein
VCVSIRILLSPSQSKPMPGIVNFVEASQPVNTVLGAGPNMVNIGIFNVVELVAVVPAIRISNLSNVGVFASLILKAIDFKVPARTPAANSSALVYIKRDEEA